jgi:hypothetical protein
LTTLEFTMPIRVQSPNHKAHWQVTTARRKRERAAVAGHCVVFGRAQIATLRAGLLLGKTALVILTRIGAGELDSDNLQASLKSVRDQVASELGPDDADPRLEWVYQQEKCKRGRWAVRVRIEAKL